LLVTNSPPESAARIRLDAVAATQDGFELSRVDLEQRREGDVLGASQSGTKSHLRLLRVLRDEHLIDEARSDAQSIIDSDPHLNEHPELAGELSVLQRDEAAEFIDKG